jgi:photosystem II stability/assembly factor-like uncharacterized protein
MDVVRPIYLTDFYCPNIGGHYTLSIRSVRAEGSTVLAAGIENSRNVLYRSLDKGITWQQVSNPQNFLHSRMTSIGGVFYSLTLSTPTTVLRLRSRDNGTSWESLPVSDNTLASILLLQNHGNNLLSISGTVATISSDNGQTWQTSPMQGTGSLQLLALCSNGKEAFVGTRGAGVFRSTDDGKTWQRYVKNMRSVFVNTIAASGNQVVAGTAGAGIYVSNDAGRSWGNTLLNGALAHTGSLLISGNRIYAAGVALHTSSNNGASWQSIPLPSSPECSISTVPSLVEQNGQLYILTNCGVFSTALANIPATNWNAITTLPLDLSSEARLYGFKTSLFAVGQDSVGEGVLMVSSNGGQTWAESFRHNGISTMAKVDNTILMAVGETTPFDKSTLYFSKDNGTTWAKASEPFTDCAVFQIFNQGKALLTATCGIIGHSVDAGKTWEATPVSGLGQQSFATSLAMTSNGRVFLATGGEGVFAAELPTKVAAALNSVNGTTSVQNNDRSLLHLSISPNPTSDRTTIEFSLRENESVRNLQIVDVLGRNYSDDINISIEQVPSYLGITYRFNADALPTGVYLCRIFTSVGVQTASFVKR